MSTLLLVEDQRDLRDLEERVLKAAGYDVIALGHSEDALQLAQDPQQVVDLLLTDYNLPGVSGRELALRLKSQYPGLRVLLTTGLTQDELGDLAAFEGWAEYLGKPFEFNAMLSALKRLQALP